MLELAQITKTYKVGDIETRALRGIDISFREKEFVAILGVSGSGKTTCLNIIGGLDRYDSGDLIIKGKSTKQFREKDWDAYRNNSVGFVFQSYNLIGHLSIVANVELGMTLSGVSARLKHKKALKVLCEVGLKDHLHKKPNQLSGGQMQRVAIARALVNEPEILLCDEPTGALDSETSVQILDLIKKVASDRLVIMVTHNKVIAEKYADRIINFSDGLIISDSKPHGSAEVNETFSLTKTSMNFFTALGLSYNNLLTKKGRTFLTCFASSIGIIGIAVILSLSTGFRRQIDIYQETALAEFPIIISQTVVEMDVEAIQLLHNEILAMPQFPDTSYVHLFDASRTRIQHVNVFSDEYLEHIANIDPEICKRIGFMRFVNMNLVRNIGDDYFPVSLQTGFIGGDAFFSPTAMSTAGLTSFPTNLNPDEPNYIEENFDLLYGEFPVEATDIVLVVDSRNRFDIRRMREMGFDTWNRGSIDFSEIVGTQIGLISNDDFFERAEHGQFMPGRDFQRMFHAEDTLMLRVVGIVREKESLNVVLVGSAFVYSDKLAEIVIGRGLHSEIVTAQREASFNVLTMEEISAGMRNHIISHLGGDLSPNAIMLYPRSFASKDLVIEHLNEFNRKVPREEAVIYTDLAATITEISSGIMNAITIVLVAFAAIALVVSLIMISIITYTSVLERTKEIGILRSLDARRRDITRVFDAETCILGALSGTLGVVIAWILTFPINNLLLNFTGIAGVATARLHHALLLVIASTCLTMLGGHIPALMASRKDAVEALRSE